MPDAPKTRFLLDAAFIALEILSLGDEMGETLDKLAEYEAKGVQHIWLIDPRHRRMYEFRRGNLLVCDQPDCGEPSVELAPDETFAE